MLDAALREEVEPGLRRYELEQAIRNISRIGDGTRYGLMLAYQNTPNQHGLGFAFYTSKYPSSVVVYAHTDNCRSRLQFEAAFCERYDDQLFMVGFLKKAAGRIGMGYVDLTNFMASHNRHWRFESFIDGKPDSKWGDNSRAWQPLWGRLIEIDELRIPFGDTPPELARVAVSNLRFHAVEGQIVLVR